MKDLPPTALPTCPVDDDLIGLGPSELLSPEISLWTACLERALLDLFVSYCTLREQTQTMLWFHSNKKRPGSYLWVCDALNLDPYLIKGRLIRMGIIPETKGLVSRKWLLARPKPSFKRSYEIYSIRYGTGKKNA